MTTMAERPGLCQFDNPVTKQFDSPGPGPGSPSQYKIINPDPFGQYHQGGGTCPLDDPKFLQCHQNLQQQQQVIRERPVTTGQSSPSDHEASSPTSTPSPREQSPCERQFSIIEDNSPNRIISPIPEEPPKTKYEDIDNQKIIPSSYQNNLSRFSDPHYGYPYADPNMQPIHSSVPNYSMSNISGEYFYTIQAKAPNWN